jgi:uncharacterized protein (TIRG00374 family)
MNQWNQTHRRILLGVIIFIALIGAVVALSEREQLTRVLNEANPASLFGAVLTTMVSFIATSIAFSIIARMLGVPMNHRDLSMIGFVSLVLNHVVSSGGLAGYSLRLIFMQANGAKAEQVIATSVLHFYLTSLVMLTMVPVCTTYLLLNASVSRGISIALMVITALLVIGAVLAGVLLSARSSRYPVLRLVRRIVHLVTRRDIGERLQQFDENLSYGARVLRTRPATFAAIILLVTIDWAASVATLGFCFSALGTSVGPGDLLTGFVIGNVAGALSMIPGGMGVLEGSMAGIFALLGYSFQRAVLSSILFRGMFYFLPYFISLAFYSRLIRRSGLTANSAQD